MQPQNQPWVSPAAEGGKARTRHESPVTHQNWEGHPSGGVHGEVRGWAPGSHCGRMSGTLRVVWGRSALMNLPRAGDGASLWRPGSCWFPGFLRDTG